LNFRKEITNQSLPNFKLAYPMKTLQPSSLNDALATIRKGSAQKSQRRELSETASQRSFTLAENNGVATRSESKLIQVTNPANVTL